MPLPLTVIRRLWKRIDRSGDCWIWKGAKSAGYGHLRVDGKAVTVHRLMYEHFYGPVPYGKFVCHRCDKRDCCRPEHLFAGTPQDNVDDMMRKGRYGPPRNLPRGSAIKVARLTEAQVVEIKTALKSRQSQPALGRKYGVSTTTINNIAHGKIWRHVQC